MTETKKKDGGEKNEVEQVLYHDMFDVTTLSPDKSPKPSVERGVTST